MRVWSLLLIGFRRIPRRILLSNLLQLPRLVETLILSLLFVRLGCNMRRVTCVAKPRVRVAAVVFTSPLFWSHCQGGIAFLKLLLKAGQARSYFASCALSFSLLLLVTVKLITLNVNGISYPVKRVGLVRSGYVISLVRDTHITDVTEASSWFSASSLLTVIAPGTVHSCSQFIIFSCQILGWHRLSCCCCCYW